MNRTEEAYSLGQGTMRIVTELPDGKQARKEFLILPDGRTVTFDHLKGLLNQSLAALESVHRYADALGRKANGQDDGSEPEPPTRWETSTAVQNLEIVREALESARYVDNSAEDKKG